MHVCAGVYESLEGLKGEGGIGIGDWDRGCPAFDPKWRRAAVGVFAGYKWLVREQLVVEPLFGIGYNFLPVIDHRRRSDVLAFINVNIGYRL